MNKSIDRREFIKIVSMIFLVPFVPKTKDANISRLPLSFPFTFAGSEQVDTARSYRIFIPIIKD